LGPEAKGEENGEQNLIFPPHPTLVLGERRKLCQLGPGQSPGRKWFYCNVSEWPGKTQNTSPSIEKHGMNVWPSVS